MANELGYVATVRGWFDNNLSCHELRLTLTMYYSQAVSDVDFATSKSVVAKWVEMGADIVSKLAAFIPGGGGAPIGLVITIIEDTYNNLTANVWRRHRPGDNKTLDRANQARRVISPLQTPTSRQHI